MTLSIIIVNHNVKHFLEHCLHSVVRAIDRIHAEVIVIDNNSKDGSVAYLKPLFKSVVFIESDVNLGFGKANNLGLEMAKGRYVLFLNPDTLIQEDTLRKCIAAFEADENVGALGVRMIDGSGQFLKESKRSFPSPLTSLYKLSGLSAMFPRSAVFSKYHLAHLDQRSNHVVDVLSGAFMMVRKEILDKTGGFDKDFFMYGEDIDLSFRVQEQGYKNLYLADTTIIHFKGESTNKGSLNYVKMFYQAMEVFAKKHYGGTRKNVFIFLIQTAIRLRALLSVGATIIKKIGLPIIDAIILLSSFWGAKFLWKNFLKGGTNYPEHLLWAGFCVFTVIYLCVAWFWGLYDKSGYRTKNVAYAGIFAIVTLLVVYSLFPGEYRFSRGMILLGSATGFSAILLIRLFLVKAGVLKASDKGVKRLAGLIAGRKSDYEDVLKILRGSGEVQSITGFTENLPELKKLLQHTGAKKIIFCTANLTYSEVITAIDELQENIRYRFYNGKSILGSHSKNDLGSTDCYNKHFRLNDPFYRRVKRLFDIGAAVILIVTFPVHLFMLKKPAGLISNIFNVLFGRKTWVGYTTNSPELLPLKPAVISLCGGIPKPQSMDFQTPNHRLDEWYAREYSAGMDASRMITFYRQLGG